jgi:hypothetical protein
VFSSVLCFWQHIVYGVIFWIYFSAINKFAVESPDILNVYGKYSIYLAYTVSAVLLAVYVVVPDEVLLRYGLIGIFVNMDAVCMVSAFGSSRGVDFERIAICAAISSGVLIAMIEISYFVVLPLVVVSGAMACFDLYRETIASRSEHELL